MVKSIEGIYRRGKVELLEPKVEALDELRGKKGDAESRVKQAKQEIKEYPNFNQAKSRMNYARTQLSVVNRKIKGLEKIEKLSLPQEKQLRKLKEKKESIFAKFFKVINR